MNRTKKGFTLIELLIVVAIMAIIATIAVPAMINASKEANDDVAETEGSNCLKQIQDAIALSANDGGVNKVNVLKHLNNSYSGATLIDKVEISVNASDVYTIKIATKKKGVIITKNTKGVEWDATEIDATTPKIVTLTMSADGTWK